MFGLATTPTYVNTTVVEEIGDLMSSVTGWITSNTYLTIFFTMALVGAAIGLFKAIKNGIVRH